ncbi:unannotated protein [freshwater metagenome]|uniref:Unannotated protein n=1 Tax=freshwater metagenome TaxID=449393 RepID=A0A6J6HZM7_9ZZZZ
MIASDITSGNGNEMGRNAEFVADSRNASRSKKIDFNRRIERRIETHGCSGVDDDVATGKNGAACIIEAEAIATDIACNRCDSTGGHFGESVFAKVVAQSVERVVLQNFARDPLFNSGASAGTNQQHDLAIGHRAQKSLKKIGAQETGGAGDEQPFAGKCVTNHEQMFTTW